DYYCSTYAGSGTFIF
nr:immunoglobulin light chain junction region [Macaca mulatta]MOX28091.1 immunoglobulin light chain junction region [Macaca mulatta]MOX28096.1 immunoglobulin light chain junction region [Macaca mulatta]MOX28100.1 immunoglobulin light chain junction region [Macaca mulatta]MOX28101.1 immunoglobulin light chain junction region [Macaca mulatta]